MSPNLDAEQSGACCHKQMPAAPRFVLGPRPNPDRSRTGQLHGWEARVEGTLRDRFAPGGASEGLPSSSLLTSPVESPCSPEEMHVAFWSRGSSVDLPGRAMAGAVRPAHRSLWSSRSGCGDLVFATFSSAL